jgi:ferritin-like metal-binding protein YciE
MEHEQEKELLAAKFDHHAKEEGEILEAYRVLAEKLGDSSAGLLVSHILTEEEMHHLLLSTMAKWLRESRTNQERVLPKGANRAELLRMTRELEQHERETIDACRSLKAELAGGEGDLLGTLLDAMILDSEKHHRLLVAVEKLVEK